MKLFKILLISTILVYSCTPKKEKMDISGKWSSFSKEDGYVEFEVDSSEVASFWHYMGNQLKRRYKIENDTLRYLDYELSAKVTILSDTSLILKSLNRCDTLFRLNDTILTFNEINFKDTITFNKFYHNFEQRAWKSWIDNGYVNEKKLKKSFIDSLNIKEIILK